MQPSGGVTPTSLFLLINAESGDRKSTMERLFFKPIHDYEKAQMNLRDQFASNTEVADFIAKEKIKAVERKIRTAIRKKDNDALMKAQREYASLIDDESRVEHGTSEFMIEAISPMALIEKLAGGFNMGILQSSEGGVVLDDKFHTLLPYLNKAWDGDTFKVSRARGRDFRVEDARLSMLLMAQSGILQRFVKSRKNLAKTSGFLARCLTIQPPSIQGQRFMNTGQSSVPVSNIWMDKFHTRTKNLLCESSRPKGPRKILHFDPIAKNLLVNFYNEVEQALQPNGQLDSIRDFASKICNNVARIAAILHVFCGCDGDIGQVITSYAIKLGYAFTLEFNYLFQIKDEETITREAAHDLYQWLMRRHYAGNFYVKLADILRLGPPSCRTKFKRDRAVDLLLQRGLIYFGSHPPLREIFVSVSAEQFGQPTEKTLLHNKIVPPDWGSYV